MVVAFNIEMPAVAAQPGVRITPDELQEGGRKSVPENLHGHNIVNNVTSPGGWETCNVPAQHSVVVWTMAVTQWELSAADTKLRADRAAVVRFNVPVIACNHILRDNSKKNLRQGLERERECINSGGTVLPVRCEILSARSLVVQYLHNSNMLYSAQKLD